MSEAAAVRKLCRCQTESDRDQCKLLQAQMLSVTRLSHILALILSRYTDPLTTGEHSTDACCLQAPFWIHCAWNTSVFKMKRLPAQGCCDPGAVFLDTTSTTSWSIARLPSSDACICLANMMPHKDLLTVCISYSLVHGVVRRDESGDEYFCCCVCCRTACATLMAAATSSSSGVNSKAFLKDARSCTGVLVTCYCHY